MKKLNYYWIILSSIFIISSCDLNESFTPEDLERYPVYFQFEYINYAWGKNHFGWFIDNQGNVMGYNQPEQWNTTIDEDFYAENDLLANIAAVDTLLYSVDLAELQEYVSTIPSAQMGPLSDVGSQGADMGTKTLYAFAWDDEQELYERILIQSIGDVTQRNTSEEAINICNWLKEVGKEIYQDDNWFSF